jgi:hypothetical protein
MLYLSDAMPLLPPLPPIKWYTTPLTTQYNIVMRRIECDILFLSGTSKLKNLAGVLGVQILYTVFMYLKVV